MSDVTGANPDELRSSATAIGNIMSDDVMNVFNDLSTDGLLAGNFATADWLLSLVHDRVSGIQMQANVLKSSFERICASLNTIAGDLESTDSGAADRLMSDVTTMQTEINNDLASYGTSSSSSSGSSGSTQD